MYLKQLDIAGFKSFARKTSFVFSSPVTAVVGPNGSGKSNVVEAFRWVLGGQSAKELRAKKGEDFIFHGSQTAQRLQHASVTITLNNASRFLNIDFDEVTIARHVYRDGVNEYYLNGSKVRLKDIIELLAGAGLGTSQHHIISQGEADRLLHASSIERREMIEDALGLSLIEYKKDESERKLAKTEENLKQVGLLRKELAPHLKYLEKQVEQIKKTEASRLDLEMLARDYFSQVFNDLYAERDVLKLDMDTSAHEKTGLELARRTLVAHLHTGESQASQEIERNIRSAETELGELVSGRFELGRQAGKIEGVIDEKQSKLKLLESDAPKQTTFIKVAESRLQELVCFASQIIRELDGITDIEVLKAKVRNLIHKTQEIYHRDGEEAASQNESEREQLTNEVSALSFDLEMIRTDMRERETKEAVIKEHIAKLRQSREVAQKEFHEKEKRMHEEDIALERLTAKINALQLQIAALNDKELALKRSLSEISYITQKNLSDVANLETGFPKNTKSKEELDIAWRKIERLRARIEEFGTPNASLVQEYETTKERDAFLATEVADLEKSKLSLEQVMEELTKKLETQFQLGLEKINAEFGKYFILLFGGGSASLKAVQKIKRTKPVDEEALNMAPIIEDPHFAKGFGAAKEPEMGIEIDISLPRKKIRSLDLLSGGERTLVSIALLFAVTQVNPPPFLVLDETDAALDESNSKKYGDMLQELSKQTQLIIITHNRETMAHAGILYGVTLGQDAISRVLSVKLDEYGA